MIKFFVIVKKKKHEKRSEPKKIVTFNTLDTDVGTLDSKELDILLSILVKARHQVLQAKCLFLFFCCCCSNQKINQLASVLCFKI
jgi:hypothetical protein